MSSGQEAIDRGLDWLGRAQLPTGELPSFATPLGEAGPAWTPDQLNFITALGALALAPCRDQRAEAIIDRAVQFLVEEREWPWLWRYWSTGSSSAHTTPLDVDDTACCALAVALRGHDPSRNVEVLLASTAADGRFHTWLLPRGGGNGLRVWWALRNERRGATRAMRASLWETTEASPEDIDGVVNANACRLLGPDLAPSGAVDWVSSIVESGTTTEDRWHHSPYVLWAAVADGARRGIGRFAALGPIVNERISEVVQDRGGVGSSLENALALNTLLDFDGSTETIDRLEAEVIAAQGPDGGWPRDICYFGGPKKAFAWASEALTTACSVGALARHGRYSAAARSPGSP